MNDKISLERIYYPVKVLGPGNRVGIWMRGCERKCPGCISPEQQIYDSSKEVSVDEIMNMIINIKMPIDGFTLSGGEPFYNPIALRKLINSLVKISDDILIFTGYTLEELKLKNNKAIDEVLNACAAIVDGAYIKKLNDGKGLRGSSNQRWTIFKHFDKYEGIENSERKVQNIIYANKILTIGIPKEI